MTSNDLTYDQRLWLAKFDRKGDWSLPETLAWVLFRNAEDAGAFLGYGKSELLNHNTDFILPVFSLQARESGASDDPHGQVEIALLDGHLKVQGRYKDGSGIWRPKPLDWQYLRFATPRGRYGHGYVIDESPFARSFTSDIYYTDVVFSRESVVATFPAKDPDPAPYWQNGETPQRWVIRPAVVAEAQKRLGASRRLGDLHTILAEMWNEPGGNTRLPATFDKLTREASVRALYFPE